MQTSTANKSVTLIPQWGPQADMIMRVRPCGSELVNKFIEGELHPAME